MRARSIGHWRAGPSLAALAWLCAIPATAFAQAWLPIKGQGSVSVGVQILHARWHLEVDGSKQEEADIAIRNLITEVSYGLTDKVALDFGVPYVASRFRAVSPCPTPGLLGCAARESPIIDLGSYYSTFQDFRANIRYALRDDAFALAPSVSVVLPTNQYETFGHAAPGRHLYEMGLGLSAGKSLAPLLRNTYVHATYVYTIAQHLRHEELDLNLNRSRAEFEVFHFLREGLSVRGFAGWQWAHGGLEWTDELFETEHADLHDRGARASHRRAGAGVAYAVNDVLELSASFLTTLAGKNTHKVGGFVFGTTWSFGHRGGMIGVTPK